MGASGVKLKIPTLDQLSTRIRQHFDAELEGTQSHIWPNNLYVVSKMVAMITYELFLRLRFIADQAYVLSAAPEYLERHGAEYAMSRLPAGRAEGYIIIRNGVPSQHFTEASQFARTDGQIFECIEAVSLDALGNGRILVRAIEEGVRGNSVPSTPMKSQSIGLGINADLFVDLNGITGGADVESDENYRRRIWFRKRYAPHAGSPSDYVRWSQEISGVTRIWVRRATPRPGSVTIVAMMDDTYDDGVPLGGDIARLREHLEAIAPSAAEIFVMAPAVKTIDIVASAVRPLTNEVRTAIEAELAETFRQRSDLGKSFSRSWISQAISNAVGEDQHILEQPVADVSVTTNEIPVLGEVTLT
jgi:uncharacterized phage protein gp47/JayE